MNVHKSNVVKEVYGKHKIIPIFNVAYSPQFNPIEAIFSKVKAEFNARRLNCLVNKIGFNIDNTIGIAFRTIKKVHCAACVRKSMHQLERECE